MSNFLKIKKNIKSVVKYEAGIFKLADRNKIIKLSSNEGAFGTSSKIKKILKEFEGKIFRYPDPESNILKETIAKRHKLNKNNIICGNGSDEILTTIAKIFSGPGDEILYSEYGFLMYPIASQLSGAKGIKVKDINYRNSLKNFTKAITKRTKIIFIANPNNPTGTYLTKNELNEFILKLPKRILLVIDAAYAEYITKKDYSSGKDLVKRNNNVIMTRTFSKIYGLAGLRLGWAYGPKYVVDIFNKVRLPFNINIAAMKAGISALSDRNFYIKSVKHNSYYLNWLTKEIVKLGLIPIPSVANFILVKFPSKGKFSANKVNNFLLSKGVILRKVDNYGLKDFLRISIGRKNELTKLIEFLKIYFKKKL
jgi:histidinol-phosphate aminotransferase